MSDHHHHHHGHGGDDPHNRDFTKMEEILQRDFSLKSHKMTAFLTEAGLCAGSHVLEIGCGFCPLLEFYKKTIGEKGTVTLVDPNEGFKARLEPRLGDNARFLVGDGESNGEEFHCQGSKAGYDFIVFGNVYHHLPSIEKAMEAVMAKLRSGGRVIVFDFLFNSHSFFSSVESLRVRSLLLPDPNSVSARCADTLAACGFKVKRVDNYVLQGAPSSELWKIYVDFMVPFGLNALVKKGAISEADKEEIMTKEVAAMGQDKDAVLFSDVMIQVAAEKP